MRTAILFSGTAYNFRFSIQSLMENLVLPNDADVFILTSRYNMRRKSPHTGETVLPEDSLAWRRKAQTVIRDETTRVTQEDENFIRLVFGDRLKNIAYIEDDPAYLAHLEGERKVMMGAVNRYRSENKARKLPLPFGGDVETPDNGNIKCVVDQYNHAKKGFSLMEVKEIEQGFKYDVVARVRLDFICPQEFSFQSYIHAEPDKLQLCGSVRRDPFEWADEFCWFSNRDIAEQLFTNLDQLGFIVDRKYVTIYLPQNNDFVFAPETQFSLLLYRLNIPINNVKIYRSARWTDGGDGFDYMNYKFSWGAV